MRLVLLLFIIIIFYSCTTPTYKVKLPNGSVVKADDHWDRDYKVGDTVCIKYNEHQGWHISNMGVMIDSIDVYGYEWRIGVIK